MYFPWWTYQTMKIISGLPISRVLIPCVLLSLKIPRLAWLSTFVWIMFAFGICRRLLFETEWQKYLWFWRVIRYGHTRTTWVGSHFQASKEKQISGVRKGRQILSIEEFVTACVLAWCGCFCSFVKMQLVNELSEVYKTSISFETHNDHQD